MKDVTKLPVWAQDLIRQQRYDIERLTRERDNAQRERERLSGEVQEALDCLWACAKEGSHIAQVAQERHNVGESLRLGHTDY